MSHSSAAVTPRPKDTAVLEERITPVVKIPSMARKWPAGETYETQLGNACRSETPMPNTLPVVPPKKLPERSRIQPSFVALQKWEGRVLEVGDSTFSAVVEDSVRRGVEEEVEFDLEEIGPDDRNLLKPGAIFYWTIGYRTEPSGERSRSSVLVLRRLPAWNEEGLQRARRLAEELRKRFDW